jgi:hypothetical protein
VELPRSPPATPAIDPRSVRTLPLPGVPAEVLDLAPASTAVGAHNGGHRAYKLGRCSLAEGGGISPHAMSADASELPPRVSPQQIGSSSLSLAPPRTNTVARVVAPAESSPEPSSRCTPPGRAAESRHRPPPRPNRLQESGLGNLPAASRPAGHGRRLAGIWPEPRRLPPQGPHCKVWNLSRVLYVNRGYFCKRVEISRDPGAKLHQK